MKIPLLAGLAAFLVRVVAALFVPWQPDAYGYLRLIIFQSPNHYAQLLGITSWLVSLVEPVSSLSVAAVAIGSVCAGLTAMLAVLLARWLGASVAGEWAAGAVVMFWPSYVLWTSQPLKDGIVLLSVFAVLAGAYGWWRRVRLAPPLLLAGLLLGWWISPAWVPSLPVQVATVISEAPPLQAIGQSLGALSGSPAISVEQTPAPVKVAPAVGSLPGCPPLGHLLAVRQGYQLTPGRTDIPGHLVTCADVLRYVPRAVELSLIAPWNWQPQGYGWFVGIEERIGLLILVGLLAAPFRRRNWPLLVYVLLGSIVLGTAIANFGTLYRLRLVVLLPALVLSVIEWAGVFPVRQPREAPPSILISEM